MANAALESSCLLSRRQYKNTQRTSTRQPEGRIQRANPPETLKPFGLALIQKVVGLLIQSWFLGKRRHYGFFLWSHGVSVPQPNSCRGGGSRGKRDVFLPKFNKMCVSLFLLGLACCLCLPCTQDTSLLAKSPPKLSIFVPFVQASVTTDDDGALLQLGVEWFQCRHTSPGYPVTDLPSSRPIRVCAVFSRWRAQWNISCQFGAEDAHIFYRNTKHNMM